MALNKDFKVKNSLCVGDSHMVANSACVGSDLTVHGNLSTVGNVNIDSDTTILGNLSVQGDMHYIDTTVTVTSALSVINSGTGPALYIQQKGSQPIAHFVDANGDDIVFSDNGFVGIGIPLATLSGDGATPQERLTVSGNISALGSLSATGSSDNYFAGDVGIGTNIPSANLHVKSSGNGEIEVERASGALINLQAQSAKGVIGTDSNHQLDLKANGGVKMTLETGGNVGINCTNPVQKLDIGSGHVRLDDTYKIEWGGSNARIDGSNSSDYLRFFTSDTERIRIVDGGNVGIGTSAPAEELTVAGGISAQNGLSANSICAAATTNGFVSAGRDLANIFSTGGGTIGGSGTINYIPKWCGSTGLTNSILREHSGGLSALGGLSASGAIYFSSCVGIGTTAPAEKLTVHGNISASGSLSAAGPADNYFASNIWVAGGKKVFLEDDKGTYIQADSTDRLRSVVGGKQMLLLDQDTGDRAVFGYGTKVGINIGNNTTPASYLTVAGDISASGPLSANEIYTAATTRGFVSAGRDLADIFGTGGGSVDGTGTANYIPVWSDSDTLDNSLLRQHSSGLSAFGGLSASGANNYFAGNVGIGTIAPGSILELQGDGGNNKQLRLASGSSAVYWDIGRNYNTGHFEITEDSGCTYFLIDKDNGNVGIGTTAPAEKLTVHGNISASGSLSAAGPSSNYFASRVGINTIKPATLLHVDDDDALGGICVQGSALLGTFERDIGTSGLCVSILGSNSDPQIRYNQGVRCWVAGVDQSADSFVIADGAEIHTGVAKLTMSIDKLTVGGSVSSLSGYCSDAGTANTRFGTQALNSSSGGQNTAIGLQAMLANTTGYQNVAVGEAALTNNTEGLRNVAVGCGAAACNTTGDCNVAIGCESNKTNSTGNSNVAVGSKALFCNTLSNNVAVGSCTLSANVTNNQTAVGHRALHSNTLGNVHVAVGVDSLLCNTIGANNVAVGGYALQCSLTGSNNTSIGHAAGMNLSGSTMGQNVLVGSNAGRYTKTGATWHNGCSNTLIGYNTRVCGNGAQNETVIGNAALGCGSNTISIGNADVTNTFIQGSVSASGILSANEIYTNKIYDFSAPASYYLDPGSLTRLNLLQMAGYACITDLRPSTTLRVRGSLSAANSICTAATTNGFVSAGRDLADIFETCASSVDGSGTANYIPLWSDSDTLGNSLLRQHSSGLSAFGGLSASGDVNYFAGKVGIGTNHPETNLEICSNLDQQHLYIQGANSGVGALARLKTISSGSVLELETGTASDSRDILKAKNSSGTVFNLQADGKLGIGTENPSQLLTIGGSEAVAMLSSTNGRCTCLQQGGGHFHIKPNMGCVAIANGQSTAGKLQIYNNAFENIRLNSNGDSWLSGGDVGIGTDSPSQLLDIHTASGDTGIRLYTTPNTRTAAELLVDSATNGNADFRLYCATNITTRITTNASNPTYFNAGNVGIGTTTPGEKLTVSGNISANGGLSATGADSYFACNVSVGGTKKIYLNKSEDTYIDSDSTDRLRVVAGGHQMMVWDYDTGQRAVFGNGTKVYIGTNDNALPQEALTVAGNISALGALSAAGPAPNYFCGLVGIGTSRPGNQYFNNLVVGNDSSGDKGITVRSNSGNRGILAFSDGDSGTDRYDGYIAYDHTSQSICFFTNAGNHRMSINGSGQFAMNATSFPSDSNLSVKAIASNQGVVFGENAYPTSLGTNGLSIEGGLKVASTLSAVSGVNVPDSSKITLGNNRDLQLYHDGSNSYIRDESGTGDIIVSTNAYRLKSANNGETMMTAFEDGAVNLYHDNISRFSTTDSGVCVVGELSATGGVHVPDSACITAGNHKDLQIYHDGSNSVIKDNGTGALFLLADASTNIQTPGGEAQAKFTKDGSVDLYYNGSKKFGTTNTGVGIFGSLSAANSICTAATTNGFVSAGRDLASIFCSTDCQGVVGTGTANYIPMWCSTTAVCNSILRSHSGGISAFGGLSASGDVNYFAGKVGIGTNRPGYALTIDNGDLLVCTDGGGYFQVDESACAVKHSDSVKAMFGTSNSLQIYHDGNNKIEGSTGYTRVAATNGVLYLDGNNTCIRSGDGGETQAKFLDDGAVELYHDNSKKFETTSTGICVAGLSATSEVAVPDDGKITAGNHKDLQIYHDGSNSYIDDTGTGDLYIRANNLRLANADGSGQTVNANNGGNVELFFDDSKKFETTSTGVCVAGLSATSEVAVPDNGKITAGNNKDLEIFHNGSLSYVRDVGTGGLHIQTNGPAIYLQDTDGNALAQFTDGGSNFLMYNSAIKLTTKNTGVDITGGITASGDISASGSLSAAGPNPNYFEGKVGVGTIAPGGKLHVKTGASSQTCTTGADELLIEGSDHTGISILAPAAKRSQLYFNTDAFLRWVDSDGVFTIDASSASSNIAIGPGGANVGIGTTSPVSALHVAGGAYIANDTTVMGNLSVHGDLIYIDTAVTVTSALSVVNSGTGPALFVAQEGSEPIAHFVDRNGDDVVIDDDGAVGIGTYSPQSKLHVSSGDIRIDNNQNYLAETAGGGNISVAKMDGSDNLLIGDGNLKIDVTGTSAMMTIDSSGNVEIGDDKKFKGSTYSSSYIKFNDDTKVSANSDIIFDVNGSNELMRLEEGGNVGIGTTAPADKLTVHGNISASGSLSAAGTHPNYFAGNTGVGTRTPDEKLTVSGNISASGSLTVSTCIDTRIQNAENSTTQLYFNANNGNSGNTSNDLGTGITWKPRYSGYSKRSAGILQIGEGNYFKSGLGFFTNNTSDASTDWSERMRLSMDGNLGIGEDEPGERLSVSGNISASGNGYFACVIAGGYFEEKAASPTLAEYPTGSVVVIGQDGNLVQSTRRNDRKVFGVTQKGVCQPIVLGAEPVLVTGDIRIGDYITTSDKPGHGERSCETIHGAVIAQAMEAGCGDSYLVKAMIRKM